MAIKSICHILYKLDYGGLENGVINIINHLPKDKYAHTIISLKAVTDFRERLTAENVEIYEINKSDGKDFRVYGKVWTLLRSINPDVVHTRNIPTVDMLFLAYLSGRRSLIHSEHGFNFSEAAEAAWRYKMLRRTIRLLPVKYVAVSRNIREWLRAEIGIQPRRVLTIHNGVDTNVFAQPPEMGTPYPSKTARNNPFIIGHVGRFAPIKNQVLLVKAFCLLLVRFPHLRQFLRLFMIGDGPQRAECEKILADCNASEVAWLPGFLEHMPDVYRKFDLFVLPSIREGISNTLLEAMACGIPVVATDVGGTAEVVLDGRTGMLVKSGNIDSMANAIMSYVSDRGLLYTHGKNARTHIQSNFSLAEMIREYDQLYSLA